MATHATVSHQLFTPQDSSLDERIEGSILAQILTEFFSTSALFPILDAIRGVGTEGWIRYLQEPSHYALFGAALIQAWFLGVANSKRWYIRFGGNLLGFMLYAPLDIALEGMNFFNEPYHWLFGGFSLLMAIFSAGQSLMEQFPLGQTIATLLLNTSKILLFPAIYLIVELHLELPGQLTWQTWQTYMAHGGHRFIFYGALFFGALLGLAEAQRLHYAQFLRYLAHQLKQYSEWSLSSDLIANALDDPRALQLQRVEKTMMFMDIRGFTAWSEQADPRQAVEMLNKFYNLAERIINRHGGHKPNFTADEIMTRFTDPHAALETALELQSLLQPLLTSFDLAVGLGLHTGEVIEGLMGSKNTRKYDIIGDAVNTAKRLESAAGRGEILISAATYQALGPACPPATPRTLQVKGKSEKLHAFALAPLES